MRNLRHNVDAYLRNADGSNAVEFALIAPVLLLFVALVFGGGMLFYSHTTITTYAREAARGVALGYMTAEQAKTFAETNSEESLGLAVDVVIDPPVVDDEKDRDVVVTISIADTELKKLIVFSNFVTGGLQSKATMRSVVK